MLSYSWSRWIVSLVEQYNCRRDGIKSWDVGVGQGLFWVGEYSLFFLFFPKNPTLDACQFCTVEGQTETD